MNTLPPLPPKPTDWWSRNWKWFVPAAGVTCLAFVAALFFSIFAFLRSSDAYMGAVARVRMAPAVVQAVGAPISEGLFFTGTINVNGATGHAEFAIPIEGPKGKATVYVVADKSNGPWRYARLIVECEANGKRVDLSEK